MQNTPSLEYNDVVDRLRYALLGLREAVQSAVDAGLYVHMVLLGRDDEELQASIPSSMVGKSSLLRIEVTRTDRI